MYTILCTLIIFIIIGLFTFFVTINIDPDKTYDQQHKCNNNNNIDNT